MSVKVSSILLQRLLGAAEAEGQPRSDLCARVGLDPSRVRRVDGWYDADRYYDLWREVVRGASAGASLRVARVPSHDLLRALCKAGETVEAALEASSHYLALRSQATTLELRREGSTTVARLEHRSATRPEHAFSDEHDLADFVTLGREESGREWAPLEVRFVHREHEGAGLLAKFFGCPVRYRCPHTELHLDRRALPLPLRGADPAAWCFFVAYADKLLPVQTQLALEVVRVLNARLEDAEQPQLDDVACALGVPVRTLRRKLLLERTSFQKLLDAARAARARGLLERGVSITEVTLQLGFSEPSAFYRAFRRWSGTTPQAWARRA